MRVYKEGFEPFEARADVAGGKVARIEARLRALKREEIGRLQVVEPSGKVVEVLVDGVVVGKTPRWEGPIAVGVHTVALRGEGEIGTQPASVRVKLGQVTALSLAAEAGASRQIEEYADFCARMTRPMPGDPSAAPVKRCSRRRSRRAVRCSARLSGRGRLLRSRRRSASQRAGPSCAAPPRPRCA